MKKTVTRVQKPPPQNSLSSVFPRIFLHGMLMLLFGLGNLDKRLSLFGDVISVALVAAGAPLTHTVGGGKVGYRLYQPFTGGPMFIALQILGWLCYGLSLLIVLAHLLMSWKGQARVEFFLVANLLGIGSQVLLHVAIAFFDPTRTIRRPWHDIAVFNILVGSVPVALFVVNEFASFTGDVFLSPGWRMVATLTLFCAAPLTHFTAVRLEQSGTKLDNSLDGWNGSSDLEDLQTTEDEDGSEKRPQARAPSHKRSSTEGRRLQKQRQNLQELEAEQTPEKENGHAAPRTKPKRRNPLAPTPAPPPTVPPTPAPRLDKAPHKKSYRLFQPFIGGEVFVFLQMIGWAIYSIGLVLFLSFVFFDVVFPFYHWVAGLGGFLAQGLLLSSLFVFERSRDWRDLKVSPSQTLEEVWNDLASIYATTIFYQIPLITFSSMVLIFVVLPFRVAAILFSALSVAYMARYDSRDQETGSRRWQWFRDQEWIWQAMFRYFSAQLLVDPDPSKRPQADKTYLYAFHPHGIYPTTCFWLTLSGNWKRALPGVEMDMAGASILLKTPVVRDIVMWGGGIEVTRKAIGHSLDHGRSVLLVPGGQKEMRHTSRVKTTINVVTKNKGFVRIAMQRGVPLVPVLSFGEEQILHNIRLPAMQEFFYKRIGFNFPHFPYGRFYLPIPNKVKVSVAVGEPIAVPHLEHPTEEEVDEYHQLYFDQLRKLFDRWKRTAECADSTLVYHS